MELIKLMILAAVLMTACGTPAPGNMTGQSDSSVTPSEDRGSTPGTDAGQSDSTPPPPDVPMPSDTPALPEDVASGDSFMCGDELCAVQNVFNHEGTSSSLRIQCDRTGRVLRAALYGIELADGWTECRGNECSSMMEGMVRRVLRYTMTGGRCSSCADILDFSSSGAPMARTSGVRQICRRE